MKNSKKKPLISVVIPAYNEEKLIGRCLSSLTQQTFPREDYEIIMVNNASTDKTALIAKNYADRVINEPRKGLLFARQKGFGVARGELIFRTDADTILPQDWIERGFLNFQKNPKIVALSGFYFPDNNRFFLILFSWFTIWTRNLAFKLTGSTNWLSGPCSAFKKEIFKKVGGFDLKADPWTEDQMGIAWKIRRLGPIGFDPSWWVWFSMRRVENRSLNSLIKEYLLYEGWNFLYFSLFKKSPKRTLGGGWQDIRP